MKYTAKKNKIKEIIWLAVALVFFVVAAVVGHNLHSTQQAISRQDAIREAALRQPEPVLVSAAVPVLPVPEITEMPVAIDLSDQPEPAADEPEPRTRHKQSKPNERFINFEELWELNPDVIAWIEIPGTIIDYPIVSTLCNQFYIYHDLMGQRTGYGALFTDIRNHQNWQDPFIIVYGHNMRDGRKFADLHLFLRQGFFRENGIIHIYTPYGQFSLSG